MADTLTPARPIGRGTSGRTLRGLPVEQRFWLRVDKQGPDECWAWRGSLGRTGYGSISVDGVVIRATHMALELDGRSRPSAKHGACHSCDTPSCVNPRHLWWGTQRDNLQDAAAKGRTFSEYGTHCRRGHEFSHTNKHGKQICKICQAARARLSFRRKKEAASV